MTLVYYSPEFLEHDTGNHPENRRRIEPSAAWLTQARAELKLTCPSWYPIAPQRLARVHPPEYSELLRKYAEQGGGRIEVDTVLSRRSYDVALLAAGAVCDAVERVVRGEDTRAFCLVRPPGHHARPAEPMGFCLFANVALGARLAIDELGLSRVLIVDWDVHHGNGTQAIFWEDPQVGFFSIHRYPFYPGSGGADETGAGPGLGATINVPIAFGTPRSAYHAAFASALARIAKRIRPELVLISAGFDAHRLDPIGSLELESEDFLALTRLVCDVAAVHASGRVVSVLEGGYHPAAVAESVAHHVRELAAPN
jgi:acetoin utilization deacetylase AcuC-like enzyme